MENTPFHIMVGSIRHFWLIRNEEEKIDKMGLTRTKFTGIVSAWLGKTNYEWMAG